MNYESMIDDLHHWNGMFGGGIPSKADIEAVMRGEVDKETLKGMLRYTHSLERGTTVDEVGCIYPDEWSLAEFEAVIAGFVGKVPAEYRDRAQVKLSGGYDESTHLRVCYERPKTDEEWGLDCAHALMHVRKGQADDLAVYERLHKKFAGNEK